MMVTGMASDIPLRKELVTIGFSITSKIPREMKENFRSFLIAIDDNDILESLKKYDELAEMANKCSGKECALSKAFLLLAYSCIYENEPAASKPETVNKIPSKMTDEQFAAEIDKAFADVEKERDDDIISIDPKAIEKAKKKPVEDKPAPGEWIPW